MRIHKRTVVYLLIAVVGYLSGEVYSAVTNIAASRADAGRIASDITGAVYCMPESLYTNCICWWTCDKEDGGNPYSMTFSHIDGGSTNVPAWDSAGRYFDFGTDTDYMTLGGWDEAAITNADSITISMRVWVEDNGYYGMIFAAEPDSDGGLPEDLFMSYVGLNDEFQLYFEANNQLNTAYTANDTIPREEWVNLCWTYGDGGVSVYQDGTNLDLTWGDTGNTNVCLGDFGSGREVRCLSGTRKYANAYGAWWTNGRLMSVEMFDRTLTYNEVMIRYYDWATPNAWDCILWCENGSLESGWTPDSSTYSANTGALSGVEYDDSARWCGFDSTADYVVVSNLVPSAWGFTMAGWTCITADQNGTVMSLALSTASRPIYSISYNATSGTVYALRFNIADGAIRAWPPQDSIVIGETNHVAAVFEAASAELYINGESVAVESTSMGWYAVNRFSLGQIRDSTPSSGTLGYTFRDWILITNALSDADVRALYNFTGPFH